MSLPAAEQRLLEGIEEGLRASEPRLAGMYAIFTRLTSIDGGPRRERLPSGRGLRAWRVRLRYAGAARRRRRQRPTVRPAAAGSAMRWLVVSQLVLFLAVVGLFIGFGAHTVRASCHASTSLRAAAAQLRTRQCTAQASSSAVQAK